MRKRFNVTGVCIPEEHYMVDISAKIKEIIEGYITPGYYFTINRARQYGKTTTLDGLSRALSQEYYVLDISFESADIMFASEESFCRGFEHLVSQALIYCNAPKELLENWERKENVTEGILYLGTKITSLCQTSDKKIILMIDEVDKSSENQIFLTFLGMLRDKYLGQKRGKGATFHSVVLSGVYDIKNLKLKLRPDSEHKYNSPWNIAEAFTVDMTFSPQEIATMIASYEQDYQFGINIEWFSNIIYEYTSGYPYLVSLICKLLDEKVSADLDGKKNSDMSDKKQAWTYEGFMRAVKMIVEDVDSSLFDDLNKKLADHSELNQIVKRILLSGEEYAFNRHDNWVQLGSLFGFLVNRDGKVAISNRIFETILYNKYITEAQWSSDLYQNAILEKNQFILNGQLNVDMIIERFKAHFESFYGEKDWVFVEDEGRLLFLTFLKPIINGVGNYYVEARTRDLKRTDIIIDYLGRQYVIELKIYRGEKYQESGYRQLCEYLDLYGQDKGWLLSFCFLKHKEKKVGICCKEIDGKTIVEAII